MNQTTDHDLLIKLDTQLSTVIDEMRLLRDDSSRRLDRVEREKLDKVDFSAHLVIYAADKEKAADIVTNMSRLLYIGVGISIALQFLIPIILPYFHK